MRNHTEPKIKWADITHDLKKINNIMMPNTSTLTTEQQERCYDFFIKHADFEANNNQNAHINREFMKRIVKNSLLHISGNDQPWHNRNGYATSNYNLYVKHPHKRLGFLSQLQFWQDCFNQPKMPKYNYETFFCKNQDDFTLFFIATIESLADKYQHSTASLNSIEKKKEAFKNDPHFKTFLRLIGSKTSLNKHLLLKLEARRYDYVHLHTAKAYQILEIILSELPREKATAQHSHNSQTLTPSSDKLTFEAMSPQNISMIESESKRIVDFTRKKIEDHQLNIRDKKELYSTRKKKYKATPKSKKHTRARRKQWRKDAKKAFKESYLTCRKDTQTFHLFDKLLTRTQFELTRKIYKINALLERHSLLCCSQMIDLILKKNDQLAAMAMLKMHDNRTSIELNYFAVNPQYQRQGLGKLMLSRISSLLMQSLNKQKDSGDSIKFVIPQPVKLAHDFYKRQGFYDEQTSIDDDAMSEYECETAEQFISVYDYEDIPRNNYGKISGSMSKTITCKDASKQSRTSTGRLSIYDTTNKEQPLQSSNLSGTFDDSRLSPELKIQDAVARDGRRRKREEDSSPSSITQFFSTKSSWNENSANRKRRKRNPPAVAV